MSQIENARPLIEVEGLYKQFGAVPVLRGIDFQVRRGEVAFIIGPSGGGKSTLLRCINFMEMPDGGTIRIGDETLCSGKAETLEIAPDAVLRKARARMPMVFQHFNLFHHMTVLDNVMEGPVIVGKRPKAEVRAEARELLSRFGLAEHEQKYPAQLSGGQKQRVAIVRALALKPDVILFDEPTSALDPQLVNGVLDAMRELARSGLTLVIVSHEMAFAQALADSIYFVHSGRIAESGTPAEIFDNPRHPDLKEFMASVRRT